MYNPNYYIQIYTHLDQCYEVRGLLKRKVFYFGLGAISAEEKTYIKLLKKFWIASTFTLPIFLIAMSEMLHNNPLYNLMDQKYWNWIQFVLSIPVVFYATWMFFERAYRSIKTWNLNMFTLIGIGSGVAWLFSVFGMFFPDILHLPVSTYVRQLLTSVPAMAVHLLLK